MKACLVFFEPVPGLVVKKYYSDMNTLINRIPYVSSQIVNHISEEEFQQKSFSLKHSPCLLKAILSNQY